ncbi:MAG: YncE family protein [Mycobacterium sp.]|uniref:YncE family protein n=1 Tax=Mycobacterium sp. TaxID=1785 RepID=UPI00260E64F3|nr:YncE family protein [Mycobacterium sp.]MDI3315274.1 YncE family protein [Mycobacterium sp.]
MTFVPMHVVVITGIMDAKDNTSKGVIMHPVDCDIHEGARDGPPVGPTALLARSSGPEDVGTGQPGPSDPAGPPIAYGAIPEHCLPPPTILATIGVGEAAGELVVSPDGCHVYVGRRTSVAVLSRLNNIVGVIPTGGQPKELAISADGSRLYVTGYDGSVSVVDATEWTTPRRVMVIPGASAAREVITADGALIYVAHHAHDGCGWISVHDSAGGMLAAIPGESGWAGYTIADLAVNPDGTRVYVGWSRHSAYRQYGHGFISVIDTAAPAVIDTIDLRGRLDGITVSPDGSRMYATHADSQSVSAVDLATHRVTPIALQDEPLALAFTPDSVTAYVAGSCSLSIIDTVTNEADRIMVGDLPRSVQISPDGKCAFIGDFGARGVSVIDTVAGCVVGTIDIGGYPQGLAISPDGCRLYVSDYWSGLVTVVGI